MNEKRKRIGESVRSLIGIKGFTEYGLLTNGRELLFFSVTPTNISVLSGESMRQRVGKLTVALSAIPYTEIVCTDSAESFDDNKAYLEKRIDEETNQKIKELLNRDYEFLSGMQAEMTTARQFAVISRCRNLNEAQVFALSNTVLKVLAEQGFTVKRMRKEDIKRFLAIYFEASLFGESIPDACGEEYLSIKTSFTVDKTAKM